MLSFFADESLINGREMREYRLSLYGGLILNEERFRDFTTFLYDLKKKYVFPQTLEFKWRFKSVWDNMKKIGYLKKDITKETHPDLFESLKSDYDDLKTEILDYVSNSDAKMVIAIRPNELLNASEEQNIKYSIEAVSRKFEKVLEREDGDYGILLADELKKKLNRGDIIDYEYILNLCCYGSNSISLQHLILIVPTICSHISPIHQINDILLGTIQYYLLEFMRKLRDDDRDISLATNRFGKITGNFYKSIDGRYTINSGILLYPPKNTREKTSAGIFLNKLERQLATDFDIL